MSYLRVGLGLLVGMPGGNTTVLTNTQLLLVFLTQADNRNGVLGKPVFSFFPPEDLQIIYLLGATRKCEYISFRLSSGS